MAKPLMKPQSLKLDKYQPKFVTGNNIGKTFQFVEDRQR